MANNFQISEGARDDMNDSLVDRLDAGASNGVIKAWTGAQPATPATADSGTLLSTNALSDPAFGNSSAGVATANAISDATVTESNTPAHFRFYDSDGNCEGQGTIGTSGADCNFSSTTWIAGGTVSYSSFTSTVPRGP